MNLRMPENTRSISGKLSSSMSKTVTRVESGRACEASSSRVVKSVSLHAGTFHVRAKKLGGTVVAFPYCEQGTASDSACPASNRSISREISAGVPVASTRKQPASR
jgi:hypothetical protein